MGRPKGSKNAPKVTKAIIGEVISKPRPRISPKDTGGTHLDTATDLPENGNKMVDEGAPVPVLSDEEINNAALKEAQHVVTRRRKLSVKDKNIEEKLEFLFADMKSLRNYVQRLEDLMNVRRNDLTNEPEPITIHKRKRKINVEGDNNVKQENDSPASV